MCIHVHTTTPACKRAHTCLTVCCVSQCSSCVLSSASVVLCTIACCYTLIQLALLQHNQHCAPHTNTCHCTHSHNETSRAVTFNVTDHSCRTAQLYAKLVLSLQSVATIIGSATSFWLMTTIWQSRYSTVQSSYNPNSNNIYLP